MAKWKIFQRTLWQNLILVYGFYLWYSSSFARLADALARLGSIRDCSFVGAKHENKRHMCHMCHAPAKKACYYWGKCMS